MTVRELREALEREHDNWPVSFVDDNNNICEVTGVQIEAGEILLVSDEE